MASVLSFIFYEVYFLRVSSRMSFSFLRSLISDLSLLMYMEVR